MTQLNLDHIQSDQSNNDSIKGGNTMNHQQMKNQYDTLFRNLQSLSRTSRLSQFRHQNQTQEQQNEAFQTLSSRYFNVRIEFNTSSNHGVLPTTDISNEMISSLPLAIDPGTDLNALFDTTMHLNRKDSKERVPSIIRSIDKETNVQLGSIVEKNVTGIGVKVVSFQHCDETNIPDIDTTTGRKKLKRSKASDDEQKLVTPCLVLKNQSNAYAIPKYKTHNNNHEQVFLPCIIKDHRIRKNSNLDYKVLFFDPHLDELKIKKQWVSSKKVVSAEYMKQQLHSFLKDLNLETLELNQCCESEVAQRLAFDLRLPVDILKREFKEELRFYLDSLQFRKVNTALTYAYAKEPVSFIV